MTPTWGWKKVWMIVACKIKYFIPLSSSLGWSNAVINEDIIQTERKYYLRNNRMGLLVRR